jgi:hypothetical protein
MTDKPPAPSAPLPERFGRDDNDDDTGSVEADAQFWSRTLKVRAF